MRIFKTENSETFINIDRISAVTWSARSYPEKVPVLIVWMGPTEEDNSLELSEQDGKRLCAILDRDSVTEKPNHSATEEA